MEQREAGTTTRTFPFFAHQHGDENDGLVAKQAWGLFSLPGRAAHNVLHFQYIFFSVPWKSVRQPAFYDWI
jgi:hypothetical protein